MCKAFLTNNASQQPVIGYETREELAGGPAQFWVRVIKREKRGSHCLEEQGVVTAAAAAQIVPKGKLSNEFILELLAQKFESLSRPLHAVGHRSAMTPPKESSALPNGPKGLDKWPPVASFPLGRHL